MNITELEVEIRSKTSNWIPIVKNKYSSFTDKNIEENEHIKLGQFHTIDIELRR